MKKQTMVMMLAVMVPAVFVSAQQNPLKNRLKQAVMPNVDLSAQPTVAPGEEFEVGEFLLKRKDLKGQVVELVFDRVTDLKQTGKGYTARVTYDKLRSTQEGVTLLIPDEGLELFEELADRDLRSPSREAVYIEVLSVNMTRAVGTRYSKSKPEGERYSW